MITPDDTEQRRRALNVRRTFENLFDLGAIPIVNENDTTATPVQFFQSEFFNTFFAD